MCRMRQQLALHTYLHTDCPKQNCESCNVQISLMYSLPDDVRYSESNTVLKSSFI